MKTIVLYILAAAVLIAAGGYAWWYDLHNKARLADAAEESVANQRRDREGEEKPTTRIICGLLRVLGEEAVSLPNDHPQDRYGMVEVNGVITVGLYRDGEAKIIDLTPDDPGFLLHMRKWMDQDVEVSWGANSVPITGHRWRMHYHKDLGQIIEVEGKNNIPHMIGTPFTYKVEVKK